MSNVRYARNEAGGSTVRGARGARAGSDDLLVDSGRDQPVDVDGLGDVLEALLAEALEDEVGADALGGGGPHDDLAAGGGACEPRGHVGDGTRGGEGPPLSPPPPALP